MSWMAENLHKNISSIVVVFVAVVPHCFSSSVPANCLTFSLSVSRSVELQQAFEVDSLEYLEALETVTDKLETRVNFCKAHLMMITCFDVSSRHR